MSLIKRYSKPKNSCCLVDLDGTIFFGGGFDEDLIQKLNSIDCLKIIVTARSNRSTAEEIANRSGLDYYSIYCNASSIDPVRFKINALEEISRSFVVDFAVDDDLENIDAYRIAGVKALTPYAFSRMTEGG